MKCNLYQKDLLAERNFGGNRFTGRTKSLRCDRMQGGKNDDKAKDYRQGMWTAPKRNLCIRVIDERWLGLGHGQAIPSFIPTVTCPLSYIAVDMLIVSNARHFTEAYENEIR